MVNILWVIYNSECLLIYYRAGLLIERYLFFVWLYGVLSIIYTHAFRVILYYI